MNSFLICMHDDRAEVYQNGLPIGTYRNGVFEVHMNKAVSGVLYPARIDERALGLAATVTNEAAKRGIRRILQKWLRFTFSRTTKGTPTK